MAGGNFMHRVISYVVNEIVVNGLANSETNLKLRLHWLQCNKYCTAPLPAFQRFAVRTSKRIEDVTTKAVQKRQELAEQMKDFSKNFESKNQ